jgi:hypothetical protein
MYLQNLFGTFGRLITPLRLLLLSLVFIIVMGPEWPAFQDERHQINVLVGQRHFDFLVWEARALAVKGESFLTNSHAYLDQETRRQIVLDYLALLAETRSLEGRISTLFADPAITDPLAATRELQQQVDDRRAVLAEWQPLAEAVVQQQVATVLVEEGFGLLGHLWPPLEMHMTPLPVILIVSPREEIRQIYNVPLKPGLNTAEREAIEENIYTRIDRSALVVPIGGLGFYPAMIVETSSINYLADVTAHEWAHHWLTLQPLGIRYAASPALRTINETVASIVGQEIGERVIERYYPEYVIEPAAGSNDQEPPAFDFRAEMAETRIQVDALLAEGRVEEAEEYMEARRLFFWENGYRIRKLNQAYFAFYGAYADTPGQAGDDPIGPALVALRASSPSLRLFLDQVSGITSLEDLQELAAQLPGS